jgi:hypothetical protein
LYEKAAASEFEASTPNISKKELFVSKSPCSSHQTSNNLTDNSCVILDDSNTKENVSEIVLSDTEPLEGDRNSSDREVDNQAVKYTNAIETLKPVESAQKSPDNKSVFTKVSQVVTKKLSNISDSGSDIPACDELKKFANTNTWPTEPGPKSSAVSKNEDFTRIKEQESLNISISSFISSAVIADSQHSTTDSVKNIEDSLKPAEQGSTKQLATDKEEIDMFNDSCSLIRVKSSFLLTADDFGPGSVGQVLVFANFFNSSHAGISDPLSLMLLSFFVTT